MTKEIEEKVIERAGQWFISDNMSVKDFALSVAKYVYDLLTLSGDVQERAKEWAVLEFPILADGPIAREKETTIHNKILNAYLAGNAGASGELEKLKAENERLRKALEGLIGVKEHKDIVGKDEWYNHHQPLAWEAAHEALTKQQ